MVCRQSKFFSEFAFENCWTVPPNKRQGKTNQKPNCFLVASLVKNLLLAFWKQVRMIERGKIRNATSDEKNLSLTGKHGRGRNMVNVCTSCFTSMFLSCPLGTHVMNILKPFTSCEPKACSPASLVCMPVVVILSEKQQDVLSLMTRVCSEDRYPWREP